MDKGIKGERGTGNALDMNRSSCANGFSLFFLLFLAYKKDISHVSGGKHKEVSN